MAINQNKMDKQVYVYSVDTSAFYSQKEHEIDIKLIQLRVKKKHCSDLKKSIREMKDCLVTDEGYNKKIGKVLRIASKLKDDMNFYIDDYIVEKKRSNGVYATVSKESELGVLSKKIGEEINRLKKRMDQIAERYNKINYVRRLREDSIVEKNKIAQFDSILTRTLGVEKDKTTLDIIVVRTYRHSIFEQLIKNKFTYLGEEYQFFASSAGQTRQKKSMFIKSKVFNEHSGKLMCGLTIDDINKNGGANINKINAYTALCNTASTTWNDFDIDKAIVVDDFATFIHKEVEHINEDYEINKEKMNIEIEHMDGAGICLEEVSDKSFQFRMPYFKGLIVPFRFDKFISEIVKKEDVTVTDIYGREWNVLEEGIQYIFTKSQFKMWKYYKDWNHYKEEFKLNNCEAAICKVDDDDCQDKPINYQMLQTLSDITYEELKEISSNTCKIIKEVPESLESMLSLIGVNNNEKRQSYFQKALKLYPDMIDDPYSKKVIKDYRLSLIKEAKAGRLILKNTRRRYIVPDLFAFAQWLFCNEGNPKGILKDGEVSCSHYGNQKLDVLRSPHLYREHAVRNNVFNSMTQNWFLTGDIYMNIHSLDSKVLMFDVDGDEALIVSDPKFVEIAERNMEGILPLEYNLKKARPEMINDDNVYDALVASYSKNIGEISNMITKVFNSGDVDLEVVKYLAYENNAIIDFAKTRWMPERPEAIDVRIKEATKGKLPYFFKDAKNKSKSKLEEYSLTKGANVSTVNMLQDIVPKNNISFKVKEIMRELDMKFDHKNLMKNKRSIVNEEIVNEYHKLLKSIFIEHSKQLENQDNAADVSIYKKLRIDMINKFGNLDDIVDTLVLSYYRDRNTESKEAFWKTFGHTMLKNIKRNVHNYIECSECKGKVVNPTQRQTKCEDCYKEFRKKKDRERKKQNSTRDAG